MRTLNLKWNSARPNWAFFLLLRFIMLCSIFFLFLQNLLRCLASTICLQSLETKKSDANIIYLLKNARDYWELDEQKKNLSDFHFSTQIERKSTEVSWKKCKRLSITWILFEAEYPWHVFRLHPSHARQRYLI